MKTSPPLKPTNLLILFARYPKLGRVKTRMTQPEFSCRPLPPEKVLALYEAFLADLIPRFQNETNFDLLVRLGQAQPHEMAHFQQKFSLMESQLAAMPAAQDLGVLMEECFAQGFQAGYQRIVLIGSDAPQLSKERLAQAFQALDAVAVVIGPDTGGGMYLVGYRQPWGLMKEGIAWSQGTDCAEVVWRCEAQGKACRLLAKELDLDTSEDVQAWHRQAKETFPALQQQCPHTFQLIQTWTGTHQRGRE